MASRRYQRNPDQQRGLRRRVFLLLRDFPRDSNSDGLQFRLRNSEVLRRFAHAARISRHFHGDKRRAGHFLPRRFEIGSLGRGRRNRNHSVFKHGGLFCLHNDKIQIPATEKGRFQVFCKRTSQSSETGIAARASVFHSRDRHNRDAGRRG